MRTPFSQAVDRTLRVLSWLPPFVYYPLCIAAITIAVVACLVIIPARWTLAAPERERQHPTADSMLDERGDR